MSRSARSDSGNGFPLDLAGGDWTSLAAAGDERDLETWAARGLIAVPGAAEVLARFPGKPARLAEAAARFVAGDAARAEEILAGLAGAEAARLRSWMVRPVIDVLAFLPAQKRAPHGLALADSSDPRFRLWTVSCRPGSRIANRPFATLGELIPRGVKPDLIVVEMVEWHMLPVDLDRAPCPVVGFTADYDLHIQAVHEWLERFDLLLVTDTTEWRDVKKLVEAPVVTFPKVFGVRDDLPPLPDRERDTDVFFSGSVFHPYHPDKVRLIQELLARNDLSVEFVDGFLSDEAYLDKLTGAKTSFSFIRHPGAMPTRALEALAMGCAVAVQEGSSLLLYLGESEGLRPYPPGPGRLAQALASLARDPERERRARRGAARVRQLFGMRRVAGELFRAVAMLAALLPGRTRRPRRVAVPRRTVLAQGWLPSGADHETLKRLAREHVRRLPERVAAGEGARATAEVVREMVLEHASVARRVGPRRWGRRFVADWIALQGRLVDAEPDNLVHRFNFVRLAFHYGRLAEIARARRVAEDTLDRPAESWTVDPLDDIYPWDFFPTHTDYRAYFDEATRMVQGNGDPGRLVRLILASLHDLLGLAGGDLDHHRRAVELDPEFPFFRWNLSAALLRRGEPDDLDEAQRLLEDLARNTVLLRPATRELEALAGRGRVVRPLEGLKSRCERAPKGGIGATLDLEGRCADLPDLPRVAAKLPPAAPPFGSPAAPASVETLVVPEGHERIDYAVTAVVSVWRSRRFIEGLLDDLLSQSLGPRLEIVVVDSASPEGEGRIVLDRLRRHPNIVYLRTDRRETSHAAFSRAAALARAPYLALANTDDRHHPEALERLARVLDARPDVGLVYADFWVTVRENARFDEAPFEKLKRLEEFTLFDLLAHCSVGPQPMWRKELHHRHGLFDATLDVAGDWEMWLRFAREDVFLHVPETLGVYYYSPTSCERRDPRRAKRENEHILRAYDPLWAEQNARRREARIAAPRLDEILALIVRGDDPGRAAASVAELRKERPRRRDVRFAVVRADEGIPDVPGGPPADPPSWTLPEVMSDGWPWRYRAVALMPAGARLTARRLEELAERLFAGERTGALRVREGAGEVVLLSSSAVLDAASLLATPERPDAWLDAVARRGWNVAVCAGAETGNA